ncbi:MAG: hypothetical protein ACI3ZD_15575 [Prevotella sp.]
MKRFNTADTCRPNEHYMVDITERLEIIRKMVANGEYFCINRGRQYGKTTTLEAISNQFSDEYCIFQISFEGISDSTSCVFHQILRSASWNVSKEECSSNIQVHHPCRRLRHQEPQTEDAS